MAPRRAVIVGNAGSGKSTLARTIAATWGAPVLDLDTIVWEPDAVAVARPETAVRNDLAAFCTAGPSWVVEGCYGSLVEAALTHGPRLIFLHPGRETCLAHCRARPWEPHKYRSQAEQDRHLDALLAWVAAYYDRDGDMSLAGHRKVFDAYGGPKVLFATVPSPAEIALLAEAPPS